MTRERSSGKPDRIVVTINPDLADIIPGYLTGRRKDVNAILKALEEEDYESIRILGHSMKGSGGGYGFDYITELGAAIEEAAKSKNPAKIRECSDNLSAYLEGVEVIFNNSQPV